MADLVVVLAYLADWGVGGFSWNHGLRWKLAALVDLNGQNNLLTWYSSVQLCLTAFLLAVFAYLKCDKRTKASWLLPLLPLVFTLLSFEQVAMIHQWLAFKSGRVFASAFAAMSTLYLRNIVILFFVALGALAVACAYGLKPYFEGRRPVIAKYFIGSLVLFGCTVGIGPDTVWRWLPRSQALRVFQISLRELGKLAGVTITMWATYDLLVSHSITLTAPGGMPASPSLVRAKTRAGH
jgi:hypothetical protein